MANKLVSMFLHELSRRISENWNLKVDSEEYERIVRRSFHNRCPYCLRALAGSEAVVEHLDGMNRYRVGLHVPGNVIVACRKCNCEKRRDDSQKVLTLASFGWASFLSHDGSRCSSSCPTCRYWKGTWADEAERKKRLDENIQKIRSFRSGFPEFERVFPSLVEALPTLVTKLYSDCQRFAEGEIRLLMERLDQTSLAELRMESEALESAWPVG